MDISNPLPTVAEVDHKASQDSRLLQPCQGAKNQGRHNSGSSSAAKGGYPPATYPMRVSYNNQKGLSINEIKEKKLVTG